jgi:hypothetical protein
MVNFWNSVLGFVFLILGIVFMVDTVRTKKKIGNDTFGGIIKMGAAAIGFIILGLVLFLRELLKLL